MKPLLFILFVLNCAICKGQNLFRIGGVKSKGAFNSQGVNTGCVTWADGIIPSNTDFIIAAEYLCQLNLINNVISDNQLSVFQIGDAALGTLSMIYKGTIPPSLPSDNVPIFFSDVDNLDLPYRRAVRAMCFLEYADGISCLSREYTKIQPYQSIQLGNILRMLYEAWGLGPNLGGYDILHHSPSSFLSNIYTDDYNYGYFQHAVIDGILGNYNAGGVLQLKGTTGGEFYFVALANMIKRYGFPSVNDADYYSPNNIQLKNANTSTDITRGVFKTYEQDGLSLPSSGFGLNFVYSYHSDWTDLPLLGYDHYFDDYGNYTDFRAKEHNYPLGIGWTHTYNITAQAVYDENNNDKYIIMRWGDGSITVYNVVTNKFESAGVYDDFKVTKAVDGHIINFTVTTKDQVTTQFNRQAANEFLINPSFYQVSTISDIHGNTLNFVYESGACNSDPRKCDGTSNLRLKTVTDSRSNRSLTFSYALGTDLLNAVSDDGGRGMTFIVDLTALNLRSVTNARKYTTFYSYGINAGVNDHLLTTIQRPKGNTITNTYKNRKISQIQTPNYITNVDFKPDYGNAISTRSIVSVSPNSGAPYAITYNQDSRGLVSTISSPSVNIICTYGDNNNPTLPTIVADNNTGLRQQYTYDLKGNILDSYVIGNTNTVTNRYTYNSRNQVLTHTWPNNTVTTYTYDPNTGDKIRESALSYFMDYIAYNNDGTLENQRDATGVLTGYGYNQYGNLNYISIGNNNEVTYSAIYDKWSRLHSITDGNNYLTEYDFDENDNLKSVIQDQAGLNIRTTYDYDGNDNLVYITPPTNNSPVIFSPTILTYNRNDVDSVEQQGNYFRHWNYNTDGTLSSFVQKNGVLFPYTYFAPGDPNEGKLKSNGFQTFSYDNTKRVLNQVSTTQPDNVTIKYAYDDLLRPSDVQLNAPTFQSELAYSYYDSGNLKNLTLVNEGKSLSYYYDELNRLTYIRDWNGNSIVHYGYFNNGLLHSAELSNGATTYYHYDGANRLDSIYCLKGNSNEVLYSVGCSMDKNGNHKRESSYIQWNGPAGIPNPGSKSIATYDQYSRLNGINGQSISSDNLGNITSNPLSNFTNAVYDPINHLIRCTVDRKDKRFFYDAVGNRYGVDDMRYTVDALDNGNVLAEKKVGQSLSSKIYVYSPYGLVCSLDPQTATPTYYLYDFRGSTVATLGLNQVITNYYKYDPWGNITDYSTPPGSDTPFLFVGQYGVMYESSHLYYMRARYYDPTIGRFLGEDQKWSTNLFSYAGNNPVDNIDPNGTDISSLFSTISNFAKALTKTGATRIGYYALYFETAAGNVFKGNQYTSTSSLSMAGAKISKVSEVASDLTDMSKLWNSYSNEDGGHIGPNTIKTSVGLIGNALGTWAGRSLGTGYGLLYGSYLGFRFGGIEGVEPGAAIGGFVGAFAGGVIGGQIGENFARGLFKY